jgi:membrane-bound lytic murein transglycosylase D
VRFNQPFQIGRREDAEVPMPHEFVSRSHVEVSFREGQWWVIDLGSANGMFIDGERQQYAPVVSTLTIRLGVAGPFVYFSVEPPHPTSQSQSHPVQPTASQTQVAHVIGRYFENSAEPAGEHTMAVRQAFAQVKRKERRKYGGIMAALGLCVLAVGGYALFLYRQEAKRTEMALGIFYSMKALDVDIAGVEKLVQEANLGKGSEQLARFRKRREDMEQDYNRFVQSLRASQAKFTPKQQLIVRIVRIFGESELAMPAEFMSEIDSYIAKWQASGRLRTSIEIARANGYIPVIAQELLAQGLPPQFFYLALQESNFDPYANGPPTRSGIAKGMWQFVPETALKYGMKLGPLLDLPRPDPGDDRHNWERATKAAAAYLKDLYSTDAQASGLLVMSCYNWGEDRVIPRIRKMPANPKERNFWRLLEGGKEKIPHETYDYVLHIVSASVIGEHPRLFGFDFDNPLGFLEDRKAK